MKNKLSVGCIQLNSKSSIIKNLENTISFSNLAVNKGAEFLFTPEVSNIISLNRTELLDKVFEEKNDPFLKTFREFCIQKSVWVLLGSLVIRDKKNKKKFRIAHTMSVIVNFVQIFLIIVIIF